MNTRCSKNLYGSGNVVQDYRGETHYDDEAAYLSDVK